MGTSVHKVGYNPDEKQETHNGISQKDLMQNMREVWFKGFKRLESLIDVIQWMAGLIWWYRKLSDCRLMLIHVPIPRSSESRELTCITSSDSDLEKQSGNVTGVTKVLESLLIGEWLMTDDLRIETSKKGWTIWLVWNHYRNGGQKIHGLSENQL